MIRKIAVIAATAGAALACTVSANAMDFPATPMNSGPPVNLPGDTLVPGIHESMMLVNGVTQPILQPILAPGGGMAAAGMEKPMMKHHHHHMMMKKKMMTKKKMMMKKKMM